MQKEQIMMDKMAKIESEIPVQKDELIRKLRNKLERNNEKLRELKQESRSLLTELDEAYKALRKSQEELVVREKLSVAGGLAAGVAHEIRNSLNIIGMSVQHMQNKFLPGDEMREFTEAIMNKVEKLDKVATDLIHFARPHKPNFKKGDIHKILDGVLSLVKFKCVVQNIKMVKEYKPELPLIMIDKELIDQVFLNLIDNALWAMPKGGKLIIATRVSNKANFIEIKISDTGCGISKSDRSCIFDPFFTRKDSGTGLGLSIVHRIIEEHKGFINVESEVEKGTSFLIRLPASNSKRK